MRVPPWVVPDWLWLRLEPLLSKKPRRIRHPGREPLDDRLVLQAILFVCTRKSAGSIYPRSLASAAE